MQLPPVAVTMIRPVGITVEGLDCWPVELMKVNRLTRFLGHIFRFCFGRYASISLHIDPEEPFVLSAMPSPQRWYCFR
ncbi:predicted protein [Plenodomus lingam JN3]|uniref:Predicted protein n=1 Tax=Leptosphaeria maculans (strain JN3 / isolate v23.1.3 / race Av1-4-5-6-7-8) TaxID=985895 RepID=E5A9P7_LEPMJ|nr:predicted protein [Plenodomus lingam JN3]CBY00388.1 predicted protein [Plenodomus lingam JN3]